MLRQRNIKRILAGFGLLGIIFAGAVAPTVEASAIAPVTILADAAEQAKQGAQDINDGNPTDLPAFLKSVVNILLYIIGAVAVIMIIVGGIRYVTSNGDQGAVSGAKNTILYAVVGLVVAIMAFAIVNWIVTGVGGS